SGIFNSQIQEWANKLNTRPRKCLNWKTPYEVFFNESLHLI
ncbi:IS30 family transposase, partial [Enterococcus faecalis]|nr:IS30 family transposase [Enterococcus faecalis]